MELPRLSVSERLRELLRYDKLAGPAPRILILESQYWLDGACLNAARTLGWDVATVPVVQEGVLSREAIARLFTVLGDFRPDFVLSINMGGMDEQGLFARFFEDVAIPYVAWFVDDPRTILMGHSIYASGYTVALTWDEAYRDDLRHMGFPLVHTMPLAVDATVFDAEPLEDPPYPPAFVGNSMIDFAEREWAAIVSTPGLTEAVQEAFDRGRVTRENFGKGLGVLLGPTLTAHLDAEARRHAEMLFFVEGTRRLREELVRRLAPEGLIPHGDDAWRRLTPNALGPVNYLRDLPAFYRECAVNLNITSIQMPATVNQRVFDCPAAGGFLLTDAQSDVFRLFPEEGEIASYTSWEDCIDKLRFYRARPALRREMTVRARRRILAEHTYMHRLRRIVALLKDYYA